MRIERERTAAAKAERLATKQADYEEAERKEPNGHKKADGETRANRGPRMPAAIWADWLNSSVDRRLEVYRQLMRCKSPSDLARINCSFASDAIRSWLDAGGRMASHFGRLPR